MVRREPVLALLCITVLAPIVFYTDRLSAPPPSRIGDGASSEFMEEPSGSDLGGGSGGEGKVLAFPQEHLDLLKEGTGFVYSSSFSDSGGKSVPDSDGSGALAQQGLDFRSGEHKSRVLSATDERDQQVGAALIEQVTNRDSLGKTILVADSEKEDIPEQDSPKVESVKYLTNATDRQNGSIVMPDAKVRQLKDQLIRARVYLGLGSVRANSQFIRELRLRVREVQRALGEATKDSDLPKNINDKMKAMERTLSKCQRIQDECNVVVRKLRATLHSTEEQFRAHKKQTLFLTQLAAKTLPRGLHCLALRLSTEYFSLEPRNQEFLNQEKLENPELYHYALFSDNVLAAAAVVNSTVVHAKNPADHVFHVVTDRLNYAAMRMWFLANPPGDATIQVQNIEEFTWLNSSYSPVLKQLESQSMIDYYFRTQRSSSDVNLKYRNPKYLSILNHLRFYLPEVFPKLGKVVFLDDDVVVQKDLTALWSIDLKGKVNGAVETCGEIFHRFDRYLNFSNPLIAKNFDPRACGWAYGMNVFDLGEWKKQNVTEIYHNWQNLNHDRLLWKLGSLPPGLITFWNRTFPLDRSWHVLGLGYNPNVSHKDIERAAVVHYNGNLKPWLEIGMQRYRNYWSKHVNYDQVYVRDCNINP